jgi:hypothetical protein
MDKISELILNLSKHVLTYHEVSVLPKGLNFAVMNLHFNLDIICAVESVIPKLPPTSGMEFRWKVRSMLKKAKPLIPNIGRKELSAVKSL